MYCRNCQAPVADNAMACTSCGFAARTGNRFCWSCGADSNPGAVMCVKCGVSLFGSTVERKQRLAAGLLSLLLPLVGISGIGRLYMGYTTLGVIQLVVGILTCGIAGLWSMIDGILILSGNPETDSKGQPLV